MILNAMMGKLLVELSDAKSIGPSTRIPLGVASAIIASVLGVGWTLSARLTTIDLRLQSLESHVIEGPRSDAMRIEAIEHQLLSKLSGCFQIHDMDVWIEQARAKGVGLPDRPTSR